MTTARARLGRWLMALVRAFAAWLVLLRPLTLLLSAQSPLAGLVAAPARLAIAALLAVGLFAFVWPRSCLWGFALLLAGLAALEGVWLAHGLPSLLTRSASERWLLLKRRHDVLEELDGLVLRTLEGVAPHDRPERADCRYPGSAGARNVG